MRLLQLSLKLSVSDFFHLWLQLHERALKFLHFRIEIPERVRSFFATLSLLGIKRRPPPGDQAS